MSASFMYTFAQIRDMSIFGVFEAPIYCQRRREDSLDRVETHVLPERSTTYYIDATAEYYL